MRELCATSGDLPAGGILGFLRPLLSVNVPWLTSPFGGLWPGIVLIIGAE